MIILGIDPGTLITGYGVIDVRNGMRTMIDCGTVRNRPDRSMPLRLKEIYERVAAVIEKHQPDEFAIETAFCGKNAQSALKIGHARGVSILAAVLRQLPTSEYAPREVKKVVTGNGAASKQQVRMMVHTILGLEKLPRALDVSDALAVAICHSYRRTAAVPPKRGNSRSTRSRARAWKAFVNDHPERVLHKP
jgi:crossover junction endodeoxyribonuclease RuvC